MGVDDFSRIFSHEGRRGVSNARRGRWLAPQMDYRCNGPWNYLPFYPPELGVFLHCAEERKDRIQLSMPLFIELLVPPGCNTSFVAPLDRILLPTAAVALTTQLWPTRRAVSSNMIIVL